MSSIAQATATAAAAGRKSPSTERMHVNVMKHAAVLLQRWKIMQPIQRDIVIPIQYLILTVRLRTVFIIKMRNAVLSPSMSAAPPLAVKAILNVTLSVVGSRNK